MLHSIVIVDDHSLIAEALAGIINQFDGYRTLYEADNGKSLMERFKTPKNIPDIVLLDINMPVMNGFDTAKWLKENHPAVLVLALSMDDREDVLLRMISSGARGYLLKNIHPPELLKALDSVIEKGYYYPDWVTHKMLMTIAKPEGNTGLPEISEREMEFLKYVPTELTYKEIAAEMICSPRTVETYRDSLFEKFGVKTRVGLLISALKNHLIQLE